MFALVHLLVAACTVCTSLNARLGSGPAAGRNLRNETVSLGAAEGQPMDLETMQQVISKKSVAFRPGSEREGR